MQPGSVIADISVDQGGCIETTRPTTWTDPTYIEHGVVHFTVTNMPGAVPRTSSQALSAAIAPYAMRLAAGNWRGTSPRCRKASVDAARLSIRRFSSSLVVS
jgi:alanine dehydrogenase